MDTRHTERAIDMEVVDLSGGLLDAPRCVEDNRRRIDFEVLGLSGGPLDGRLTEEVPLEAFQVEADNDPVLLVRARIDSVAPSAHPSVLPEPPDAPARRGWWVVGAAVAAGFAAIMAASGLRGTTSAPLSEAAAPAVAAVAAPAPAPFTLVEDPLPVVQMAPALAPPVEIVSLPGPAPRAVLAAVPAAAPRSAPAASPAPSPEPAADTGDFPVIPAQPPPAQMPFDRAGAAVAIAHRGYRAAACLDAGTGSLVVPVSVTFVSSGRVTAVTVTGGALAGTPEGACVARALNGASVPAFDGEPLIVNTTVQLR